MDKFRSCNQGNNSSSNSIIRVEDATIEEISTSNQCGYVTITYGMLGELNRIHLQVVNLIVRRNTIIRDQFGRNLQFGDLREGMLVNVEFSSAMTMSIPPQSNAFRITVIKCNTSSNVIVDRIVRIAFNDNLLFVGNPHNLSSLVRFVITNSTIMLDRRGNKIDLSNLRPSQLIRVEHTGFRSPGIPPQATALQIWVL
jgi:hypothetical protein